MGADVYIIYTPLHLLYTLSLIRANERHAYVMLVHSFQTAPQVLYRMGNLLPDTQFDLLPGQLSHWGHIATTAAHSQNRLLRLISKLLNHIPIVQAMWKARKKLRGIKLDRLFIFNDIRPEAQALMETALKCHAEVWLVEDGIGAYLNTPQLSQLRQRMVWLQRLIYGRGFHALGTIGSHPAIQQAIVLYPEAANKALMRIPRHSMPPFDLRDDMQQLMHVFAPDEAIDWASFGQCVLICLPLYHHTAEPEAFRQAVERIIAMHQAQEITVLVKYHPREIVFHFNTSGVHVVNHTIPAELVCAALEKQLIKIYAEMSSILLTAGWVNPSVQRTMLNEGRGEETLVALLKQQGVEVLNAKAYY